MAIQKAIKNVTTTGFKFLNKGDTIKGYYQGQVEKTINGSPAIEHTYKTSNGTVSVLGQANILNQIKTNKIPQGAYMEIVFSGQMQKLKNGRTMKVYDVAFDLDNTDSNALSPTNDVEEDWGDDDLSGGSEEGDTVAFSAPQAPKVAAKAPGADSQARIQALLNKGKSSRSTTAA